jgi:hypothetical protein
MGTVERLALLLYFRYVLEWKFNPEKEYHE